MATVVLLRGANLGKRRFSPKAVEGELADLGAVNIGAAGTFVVHGKVADAALLKRLDDALEWEPRAILLKPAEVQAALAAGSKIPVPGDAVRRFGTALAKPAKAKLPLEEPAGAGWGVRCLAQEGRVVLGVRKRVNEAGVYPNEVVMAAWGVDATTRDWPTWEKIGKLLADGSQMSRTPRHDGPRNL